MEFCPVNNGSRIFACSPAACPRRFVPALLAFGNGGKKKDTAAVYNNQHGNDYTV